MFKIKYYDVSSSFESNQPFSTPDEADSYLKINDFVFNKNKNVYEKRQGNHYQEAVVMEF